MPPNLFGDQTEFLRSRALDSAMLLAISPRVPAAVPSPQVSQQLQTLSSPDDKRVQVACELLPLLPHSCFVDLAGGQEAYDATPAAERQQANLRTLSKAVGKDGDAGKRLIRYITKLKHYRAMRGYAGDMWPLYPCLLANFSVWLQLQSAKEGATSVAPRCISDFVSAASNFKLPVVVDSPHLGAVPAHQSNGDGFTGHVPLDILQVLENHCDGKTGKSESFTFLCRCAHTIFHGSARVQCWYEAKPLNNTKWAPGASAVYEIRVTKNRERGTKFAIGAEGINGHLDSHQDFQNQLRRFGTTPNVSSKLDDPSSHLLPGSRLSPKDFAVHLTKTITICAEERGYSENDLRDLHVTPHSIHGSMAAFAEALEWHMVPQHQMGRWKIPSATIVCNADGKRKRGASSGGPKTIAAVYSTAASCQIQLKLRCRMMSILQVAVRRVSTGADLSCLMAPDLAALGFRGPNGHEA